MTNKIELNSSEENEIGFKLKIEGPGSEISSNKPKIRFTITESKSGKGWIFNPSKNIVDDNITILIPKLKNLITEGESYCGKLEVIMGDKYFVPTEVDISFIDPMKIEAVLNPVVKKSTSNNETILIESAIQNIISKPKLSNVVYKDFCDDDKQEINKIFLIKCKANGITNLKESLKKDKERLSELLTKSVKDFINNR